MDSFDVVILSVIAIVGFAAVSSNIKEKMEEKGKKSEKEKELQKNTILCTLIFITTTIALPILLWKMDFPKQGIGVVVAVFILIDFVSFFADRCF